MLKNPFLWLLSSLFFLACNHRFFIAEKNYDQTTINQVQYNDSIVDKLIAPYRDSLKDKMNVVIAFSKVTLKKEQPEGSLGNFVCDLMMEHYAKLHPDLCVVNNGGLRIGQIAEGKITVGKIYELMPFDNSMLLVYVSGKNLKMLFEKIAQKNGWPVSNGISLQIQSGKLISAYLNGDEIADAKTYRLIVSDYLANGGDECTMLKGLPKEDLKELFRDAIINQLKVKNEKGEKIAASIDGRITEVK